MAHDAHTTATNAEKSTSNGVGMCLQWSRERAAIASRYPDAATAWRHAKRRHKGDKNPPRGAMVYWTGGSKGYGHIAVSLGGGKIRSSDAGGNGRPATVDVDWPTRTWGMPYAGWADNVNDVTIPGVGGGQEDDVELQDEIGQWSPDDGSTGKTTVGKTLNQARGYSEDTYERVKDLQRAVADLAKAVDKLTKKVG